MVDWRPQPSFFFFQHCVLPRVPLFDLVPAKHFILRSCCYVRSVFPRATARSALTVRAFKGAGLITISSDASARASSHWELKGGISGKIYIQGWGARHHTQLANDAMHTLYKCVLNGEIYMYSGGGYIFFRVLHPCFDLEKNVSRLRSAKEAVPQKCSPKELQLVIMRRALKSEEALAHLRHLLCKRGGVEKHCVRAEARVSQGHFRTGTYGLWMSLSRIPTNLTTFYGAVWLGGRHKEDGAPGRTPPSRAEV